MCLQVSEERRGERGGERKGKVCVGEGSEEKEGKEGEGSETEGRKVKCPSEGSKKERNEWKRKENSVKKKRKSESK